MSIVYSAIVPHSPLLIPAIGKENLARLKSTCDSYKNIEQDLYSLQPDTIIIISPHGPIQPKVFSMNLSPVYSGDFQDFGDFSTNIKKSSDIGLAHEIRENTEMKSRLHLITEEKLDYGATIPLFLLTEKLTKTKIIPLYYSDIDLNSHFQFGILLQKILMISQKRIAVISSADLSHRLAKNSPDGYSPKGKKFDQKVINILQKNKTKDLFKIDSNTISEVGECGLKSIAILLGILDGVNYQGTLLSYEYPFGIGYLTMKFEIK